MAVAGILLGAGEGRRFGGEKLRAELGGVSLADLACRNFLDAGLEPVVFVGTVPISDPRVRKVAPASPSGQMIETLRSGLAAIPEGPFAFAPADMPALTPAIVRRLARAFLASKRRFLVPVHGGRRGHPAFAHSGWPFRDGGLSEGAREIFRAAGEDLLLFPVATGDVLFDIDTTEDLAAARDEGSRRARLLARGDLRC